jgi:two-component system, LytTR family, sensor kinase
MSKPATELRARTPEDLVVEDAPAIADGHAVGSAAARSGRPLDSAPPRTRAAGAADSESLQGWVKLWGYAFVAYTVIGALDIVETTQGSVASGAPIDLLALVKYRALEQYTCALFVPVLFWLVHRYPIGRKTWARNAPILVLGSVLCVAAKYLIVFPPLLHLLFPDDRRTGLALFLTANNTIAVMLDYWTVIGIAHAVEYYRHAQDRERIAAQLKAQLSQAQLQALRAQLRPHFLFNTLNGVATLMHRDVYEADRMITDLADLLRATLQHTGTHEIALSDELALLRRYLAIEGTRFRDRLRTTYEIAPDVVDALVPQFLLQPLAENAIEHGIAPRPGPGHVVIGAARVGGQVHLTVRDDGLGLRSDASRGHGVGLANTRARLAELYGSAQRLTLEAASPTGGTCVTVVVPYRRRPRGAWQQPTFESAG